MFEVTLDDVLDWHKPRVTEFNQGAVKAIESARAELAESRQEKGELIYSIEKKKRDLTELLAECHKLSANLANYVSALNSAESERDELRAIVARLREPVSSADMEDASFAAYNEGDNDTYISDASVIAALNAYRKRILGEME